jgi:hypothetical protein
MGNLERWRAKAREQGWTYKRRMGGDYALFTHDACGHEQAIRLDGMATGRVPCQGCKIAKWQAEAHRQGWSFKARISKNCFVYTRNSCGHEQQVYPVAMRKGEVRCQQCKEQAWQNSAATQGWVFVAKVDESYATYIHSACGHVQRIQTVAMHNGEVVCHGCGESWATKPSNVYLLDITTACGQRFLKLGIARVVEHRTERYGLADGTKIEVLYTKAYSTGAEAHKIEKKLHKTATKIHPSIRKFKGAKKLMTSGHTECYEYSQEAINYLLFTLQF